MDRVSSTERTGKFSGGRIPVVRTGSAWDYFKSGCKQQPSPNARETRPPGGRVFRFARRDFEGWARAGGHRVSRSLHRRVARTPPLADRVGRKSLQVSPREGAGLRVGRVRWSGHYPRVRERWGGAEPLRTATRGLCIRSRGGVWCVRRRYVKDNAFRNNACLAWGCLLKRAGY